MCVGVDMKIANLLMFFFTVPCLPAIDPLCCPGDIGRDPLDP